MNKIIIICPSSFAEIDRGPLEKLYNAGYEVIMNPYKRKLSKVELIGMLPGTVGVIAGLEQYDRDVLQGSCLRVISRCGSGISNIDFEAAGEAGIKIRSTPLAPVASVSELTVGCLLSLIRKVHQMDRDIHEKKWNKQIGFLLSGSKVAVIGFGNIGRSVARLLNAFGAEVIAVDPVISETGGNITFMDLDEAIKLADIITLHCSGEKCILSSREFSIMKEGVYILNAARGGLIDEDALQKAIDQNKVAGAWLDTYFDEPYRGALCDYDQVILTPHIGSYTRECRKVMEAQAVDNLLEAIGEN